MEIILIISAAGVFWIYGGYALLVFLLALAAKRDGGGGGAGFEPELSMVIPVYNEGKVIARRLENLLEQDYPRGKLQIIVADSASADNTREAVKAYAGKGVELLEQPERRGKGSAVAFALPSCRGRIVVVTDANSYFEPGALRELVRPFRDERVGGATGRFSLKSAGQGAPARAGGLFREYENSVRQSEGAIDSCVSLFGEIFACRRELFSVDEANLAEDFETSVSIRRKGFRLAYCAGARVYEYAPANSADLFIQRKRVITGTIQTLVKHRGMLFNPRFGWYGLLILPGHKLFPVFSPFFLAGLLLALALLYPPVLLPAAALFAAAVFFRRGLFQHLWYITVVNYACLCAWFDFLRGTYSVRWQKMESTRV